MTPPPPISTLSPYPPLSSSAVFDIGTRHIHRRRLRVPGLVGQEDLFAHFVTDDLAQAEVGEGARKHHRRDRKSTRLNSSHGYISYAVFCLKKKKTKTKNTTT